MLEDAADYQDAVADLVRTGVANDGRDLYWDVRPSARYPTVEVRVADVMTSLDDAVLHAALVRSLARSVTTPGVQVPRTRTSVVTAAKWRAARFGLGGDLVGLDGSLAPAEVVLAALVKFVEADLRERGEYEEVTELLGAVLARGTSAARQRRHLETSGDLRRVAEELLL